MTTSISHDPMSVDETIPFLLHPTLKTSRPSLKLVLSRPVYQSGEYVVGTIRLECQNSKKIHDLVQSLHVYVAGRCRMDPRWHDSAAIVHLFGTHPCLPKSPADEKLGKDGSNVPTLTVDEVAVNMQFEASHSSLSTSSISENCICFWSTNAVDLLKDAPFRQTPSLKQVLDWTNPTLPLVLEGSHWFQRGSAYVELVKSQTNIPIENLVCLDDCWKMQETKEINHMSFEGSNATDLNQRQVTSCLDYTFFAQLPWDSPPSANTTCARYFYSVVAYAKTWDGDTIITTTPFTLVPPFSSSQTNMKTNSPSPHTTRVQIGQCMAYEHTHNLPCYVSPTTIIEPISISSQGNFFLSSIFLSDTHTYSITDPDSDICCTSLTVTGASVLSPSGKIHLRFNFEDDTSVVLVSACLQGNETARTTSHGPFTKKVRSYLFDTSHSYVESGYTDYIQLALSLPCDAPFSVQTDLVEVRIFCRVDVTVEKPGFESGYGVFSIDIPCTVWPRTPQVTEKDPDEVSDEIKQAFLDIVRHENDEIPMEFIIQDLRYLSFYIKERESREKGEFYSST